MKVQKVLKSDNLWPAVSCSNTDWQYARHDLSCRGNTKNADFVCAEDTRNTGLLLKHFDISAKQISFHEHNAYEKFLN